MISMELHIRVDYEPFGDVSEDQMEGILLNAGEYLKDNGFLTQEADVLVENCEIEVVPTTEE